MVWLRCGVAVFWLCSDLCGLDVLLIDMTSLTSTGMPICVMSTNIHRVTRFAAFCSSVCAEAVCEWLGRGR